MKHGSLFSGIGGFDLAAQMMNWENVFHCEIDPTLQRVLKFYWPKAKSHYDITKTDFTIYRGTIDVLTGGFPCQPYSVAGKRKGTNDSRHLWPEMLRAIREIKPTWIVGENVFGIVSWGKGLVFEQVQVDLENEGYEVQAYILPAAGVNAPHRRYRVFFVAYSASNGHWRQRFAQNRFTKGKNQSSKDKRQRFWNDAGRNGAKGIITNTHITNSEAQLQKEILGKENDGFKAIGFINDNTRDMWHEFPTQPPICGGNDGLPTELDGITFSSWRNQSIHGFGNAIVPQVVIPIFKAIQEYNNTIQP